MKKLIRLMMALGVVLLTACQSDFQKVSPTIEGGSTSTTLPESSSETTTGEGGEQKDGATNPTPVGSDNNPPASSDYFDRCTTVAHDEESLEPNNTRCEAVKLETQSTSWTRSAVTESDPKDIYAFYAKAGEPYTIELYESSKPSGSNYRLYVTVSDEQGADLVPRKIVNYQYSVRYEVTPLITGWVFIQFEARAPSSHIYKVRALPSTDNGLQHDTESFEPNNTASTAALMPRNSSANSGITAEDNVDYFAIPVSAGEEINVQAMLLSGRRGLLSIVDEQGVTYLTNQKIYVNENYQTNIKVVSGKRLYLKMKAYSQYETTFNYQLLWN